MANTVKNYTLYRLTMTLANTEYSQVLTSQTAYIRIHSEDLTSQFRFSFTAAGSTLGEMLFQGGEWFTPMPMGPGTKTVYIQSPNAGAVAQIVEFQID